MDRHARPDPRPRARRAATSRRRRRLLAVAVAGSLVLGAAGCVGKTGRNDDYVEPGSGSDGPSGRVVPHDGG
jgi:hypothetical protein